MGSVLSFAAFDNPNARNAQIASATPGDVVESGWIPPDVRDRTGSLAHESIVAAMDSLRIVGRSAYENATKVCLWDCWKQALGRDYLGIHQFTGSCVGAGGGNALFSLAAADVVKRGDREIAKVPFWLYPYGVSRLLGGMRGRGEGSFGSTFAKAAGEAGHIAAEGPGLPSFEHGDGIVWGASVEMEWSDGTRAPQEHRTAAKVHLVRSTAKCNSADDVREAIKSFYPVTIASNWGGLMRPPVVGSREPVLLNRRATTWNHQMTIQGWWDHPEHGELFYDLNQWGLDAHGRCPSGAPAGGFWIKRADLEAIVRQGETFAFSQFDGFPAPEQPLNFSAF